MTGPAFGIGMLAAGVILAIMVIPIISAITREVMTAVPQQQREAVLALGATRWEMIRIGVLRNARAGIMGGIILGLGRALGRNHGGHHGDRQPRRKSPSLFSRRAIPWPAYWPTNSTEATGNLYLSALIEIGLALFS